MQGRKGTDGALLVSLRTARGWTRERLAAEAGVSLATIWRMERGHLPRVQHLIGVADALGVSIDAVLGRGDGAPVVRPGSSKGR